MNGSGLLGRYREVLTIPQLPGLLIWALAGRLHLACTTLVITFLVAGWTGSYTLAGVVAGALTVCQSVAGPWRGRSADRGHADLYTADATLQELLFVVGPVAVAATVALAGATPGTLLVAVFVLVGGAGFAVMLRRAGLAAPPAERVEPSAARSTEAGPGTPGRPGRRSVLAEPGLVRLVVVMGLLVGGVGLLVGGVVMGARRAARPLRLSLRLGAVYGQIAQRAPQCRRAEAFGWQSTASLAGAAVTAPIVGACLDRFSPAGAGVVAASALAIAVVIVTVTMPGATDADPQE